MYSLIYFVKFSLHTIFTINYVFFTLYHSNCSGWARTPGMPNTFRKRGVDTPSAFWCKGIEPSDNVDGILCNC